MIERTSNLTVLQNNILGGIWTDEGHSCFLKAIDRMSDTAAEKLAWEVDRLTVTLKPWIAIAADLHAKHANQCTPAQQDDLLAFILKRHWHWRVPS